MRSITRAGKVASEIVAVVLLAGSCTAGTASSPPSHDGGTNSPETSVLDLLTRSGSYQTHQHTLTLAEDLLIDQCLAQKGLEDSVGKPSPDASYAEQELQLEGRRQRGYGLFESYSDQPPKTTETPSGPSNVEELEPAAQAAYQRALFGKDDGRRSIQLPGGGQVNFPGEGCLADSRERIYGDLLTWARVEHVPPGINSRLAKQVLNAPAYRAAIGRWSTCMKSHGYVYATPNDAQDDLTARYQAEGASEQLRREEIDIAVRDGECARQTRIPSVALSWKRAQFTTLPLRERQALQELTEAWLAAVTVAENIVGAP